MALRLQTNLRERPLVNHVKRCAKSRVLLPLGGFTMSRNFTVRSHIQFTCVNEIEEMYERPGGSTLTYTRDLLYILFIYLRARTEIQTFREDFHCHVIFMCVRKIYARKRNILYARLRINEKEILVETIRNGDF